MAIPFAQKLLEDLQQGRKDKLSPTERRHVVAFLIATQPDLTNQEMADIFRVTERVIRMDKLAIRENRSQLIRQEDIGLVIADILIDYDRNIRDLEKSKRAAKPGTPVYLRHCEASMKMRLDTVRALQDLGYYPKNLGNMTVNKFEYKAIVNKDGSVENRPVDLVIDAQEEEPKLLNAAKEEIGSIPENFADFSGVGTRADQISYAGVAESAPTPVRPD